MSTEEIYRQLTGVNINEQMNLWNDRGKGYYGEYLVFCELYKRIPGTCKILMNVHVPTENGKSTEVDLLLIHETGIYVFEIKHYKGTIYGDGYGQIWTQYFRTVKNSVFKNPMIQNQYHITALKNYIGDIVPIISVIVFTNDECDIRVTNNRPYITLCTLNNMNNILDYQFSHSEKVLNMNEINGLFNKLSKHSQMKEKVLYNGKEESFYSWLQPIINNLENEKRKTAMSLEIAKTDYEAKIKKRDNYLIIGIIVNVLIVIIATVCLVAYMANIKDDYTIKINNCRKNCSVQTHVPTTNNNNSIDNNNDNTINNMSLNDYFSIVNPKLSVVNNVVTFKASIYKKNEIYAMALTESSKYIVTTANGNVYEYNVFGEHLTYNRDYNVIGKGFRTYGSLATIKFTDVTKDDISNVKINGIELLDVNNNNEIINNNLELILYSK